MPGEREMKIEGKKIEVDASGVGQGWCPASEDDCPADVQEEIAAEIIDGKVSECRDYKASNDMHYRWE